MLEKEGMGRLATPPCIRFKSGYCEERAKCAFRQGEAPP